MCPTNSPPTLCIFIGHGIVSKRDIIFIFFFIFQGRPKVVREERQQRGREKQCVSPWFIPFLFFRFPEYIRHLNQPTRAHIVLCTRSQCYKKTAVFPTSNQSRIFFFSLLLFTSFSLFISPFPFPSLTSISFLHSSSHPSLHPYSSISHSSTSKSHTHYNYLLISLIG